MFLFLNMELDGVNNLIMRIDKCAMKLESLLLRLLQMQKISQLEHYLNRTVILRSWPYFIEIIHRNIVKIILNLKSTTKKYPYSG